MLEICGLINDPELPKAGKHWELEKSEIKKSEAAVQHAISSICNFSNPFTLADKDHLYSIASGAPVSAEVEQDVLMAEAARKQGQGNLCSKSFCGGSLRSTLL